MPPLKPVTICCHPACGVLTRERFCAKHKPNIDQVYNNRRPTRQARGYDKAWQKLRIVILRRDPVCVLCKRVPAKEVDHIIPKSRGGTNEVTNLQALCKPCHSRKTATEDGGFGT